MKKAASKPAKKMPDLTRPAKRPDGDPQFGLGTKIANLFRGIGLRPDEQIKEWKGFELKDPFDP